MQFKVRNTFNHSVNKDLPRYLFALRQLRQIRFEGNGFSLLEMVVVLSIIGILVSIQLPNIIGNTDKAKFIAAQTKVSNAITECATAKTNGSSESELRFANKDFLELVPSMERSPDGYIWDSGPSSGCSYMRLIPVSSNGDRAYLQGFPVLMAKLAPGGRIIKVADWCRPYGSLDFTADCHRWDPTNTADTKYRTGRDLDTKNWDRKDSSDE